MNRKQLIIASGLVAYIVAGLIVVAFNLKTFMGILRFQFYLFMPIFRIFGIILITSITLIYFLRDKSGFRAKIRCAKCNKEFSINDSKLFLRRYWCREHYLEEVKSKSAKVEVEDPFKIKIKQYLALINKKQMLVVFMGIFFMLQLTFMISGKIGAIIKWNNKDYLPLVRKAYPQFTAGEIDNFSFQEKSRLRKDIFWLLLELIAVGAVTGSFYYLYKQDKAKPKNEDN